MQKLERLQTLVNEWSNCQKCPLRFHVIRRLLW